VILPAYKKPAIDATASTEAPPPPPSRPRRPRPPADIGPQQRGGGFFPQPQGGGFFFWR